MSSAMNKEILMVVDAACAVPAKTVPRSRAKRVAMTTAACLRERNGRPSTVRSLH